MKSEISNVDLLVQYFKTLDTELLSASSTSGWIKMSQELTLLPYEIWKSLLYNTLTASLRLTVMLDTSTCVPYIVHDVVKVLN